MTDYMPDFEAIERENRAKEALGYQDLVEAVSTHSIEEGIFRSETIVDECVAAGLVWDSEELMTVSVKNRGVTSSGKQYLELSENCCGGPWRTFYVKPAMLQSLLHLLDKSQEANAVVQEHCKSWRK